MAEQDFNDWLESIEFVDSDGKIIPVVLGDDESEDFENDRVE